MKKRTYIYVDAFNLFFGSLKGTPWKWLDLFALLLKILGRGHEIKRIRYFTSRIAETPANPRKPQRQDAYLQALRHYRPAVEIHLGHFKTRKVQAYLVRPIANRRHVEVFRTEEKGTDVNLAVHLLNDACNDAFDCAVIVSNDSDLAEAMRLAKEHHGKEIGLVTPGAPFPSHRLAEHADFVRFIRPSALKQSQLPDPIPGTNIHKPQGW